MNIQYTTTRILAEPEIDLEPDLERKLVASIQKNIDKKIREVIGVAEKHFEFKPAVKYHPPCVIIDTQMT